MTRQELELKAKEFDSKLKRHPMSSEELQKVLCDFVEALQQPPVSCELADFVQFLDDEYSMKIPERVIDEWEKYYSANYR